MYSSTLKIQWNLGLLGPAQFILLNLTKIYFIWTFFSKKYDLPSQVLVFKLQTGSGAEQSEFLTHSKEGKLIRI